MNNKMNMILTYSLLIIWIEIPSGSYVVDAVVVIVVVADIFSVDISCVVGFVGVIIVLVIADISVNVLVVADISVNVVVWVVVVVVEL